MEMKESDRAKSNEGGLLKERIIYINDALSGNYGPHTKTIANDIFRSRKLIYENNKKKMNDEDLKNYLETKVDDYLTRVGAFDQEIPDEVRGLRECGIPQGVQDK